jgi:hypothetical protein
VTLVFINSQFRPIKVPESVFNALKSNGIEWLFRVKISVFLFFQFIANLCLDDSL